LNKQPHKSKLGSKTTKGEKNDMGKAENMGVISQRKKKQEGKTPKTEHESHTNNKQMGKTMIISFMLPKTSIK
jgi:hypothetical protein